MFKSNFILWVIVDGAGSDRKSASFNFSTCKSIPWRVASKWWKWFCWSLTNMLIQQIFQMFLMTNLIKLPELIRTGKLDFFLAQPASAQFLVSTRYFELGSVVITLVAVIVCVIAIAHADLLSGLGLLVFPLLVTLGVLIHYALLLMLMSLAFWMTRAQGFVNAYYNVFQIARLPREAFHGLARIAFTWTVLVAPDRQCPGADAASRPACLRHCRYDRRDGPSDGAEYLGLPGRAAALRQCSLRLDGATLIWWPGQSCCPGARRRAGGRQ